MGSTIRNIPSGRDRSGCLRADIQRIRKLKKLEEAEEPRSKSEKSSAITLDDIILAGLERGLTITDIRRMQLGQVVDFVISYNERQKEAEKRVKQEEKR